MPVRHAEGPLLVDRSSLQPTPSSCCAMPVQRLPRATNRGSGSSAVYTAHVLFEHCALRLHNDAQLFTIIKASLLTLLPCLCALWYCLQAV
jgi:hypothetical protein